MNSELGRFAGVGEAGTGDDDEMPAGGVNLVRCVGAGLATPETDGDRRDQEVAGEEVVEEAGEID